MAIDMARLVIGPCHAVFGDEILWQSAQLGAPMIVSGIFSEGFQPIALIKADDGFGPSHLSASNPMLGVQLSQFPVPPLQNDLVTVNKRRFRINEVQPDGFGAATLELVSADREYEPVSRRLAEGDFREPDFG